MSQGPAASNTQEEAEHILVENDEDISEDDISTNNNTTTTTDFDKFDSHGSHLVDDLSILPSLILFIHSPSLPLLLISIYFLL